MFAVFALLGLPHLPHDAACVDTESDCRWWAHTQRECTENAHWMDIKCENACGKCLGECIDGDPLCKDWADKGECDQNARFMVERCPSSCDLCPRLDGGALECDSCIAMQEAIWSALQPLEHAAADDVQLGWRAETHRDVVPAAVRRAVADVCVAHEWMMLGVSRPYHATCERIISSHVEAIERAWISAMQPRDFRLEGRDPHADPLIPPPPAPPAARLPRPSRALALRMKQELCLERSPAPAEGVRGRASPPAPPRSLGLCNAQRGRTLLGVSAPALGASECDACRAYVHDAVSVLRRFGLLLRPSEPPTAEYRHATRLLHGVCADLELRHNVSHGAAKPLGVHCDHLVRDHFDDLSALTYQWARPDVIELACVDTIHACTAEMVTHEEL